MTIGLTTIQHLAKLAKLKLTPEQEQQYSKDIGEILAFLDTLETNDHPYQTEKSPLLPFTSGEIYPESEKLLTGSRHLNQHRMIEIKTSLTH